MRIESIVGVCLGLGVAGVASAQIAPDRLAQLEARVQSLESELKQYRQIDATVGRVQADAAARSQVRPSSGKVGYSSGFFLADDQNKFQMKLNGFLQTRYIYNHNDSGTEDNDETGFQVRRAEIYLTGNAFGPSLFYQFGGGFDRATGNFSIITAYAGYQFGKNDEIRAGTFKGPFMAEELISSGRQQAVERSLVNTLFSLGIDEGAQYQHSADRYRVAVMVHDGTNSIDSDFASDHTDIAAAARAEFRLAGDWSQFNDFAGWKDSKPAARLGVAVDYEVAESGDAGSNADVLKYTADLILKRSGFIAFFAGVGKHQNDDGAGTRSLDQYGLLAQGGVFVIPNRAEIFARYEFIGLDGMFGSAPAIDDNLNLATVGMNWFFLGHNAKLTTDAIYVFDAIPSGSTGLGLLTSDDGPQFVFRTGFFLMF